MCLSAFSLAGISEVSQIAISRRYGYLKKSGALGQGSAFETREREGWCQLVNFEDSRNQGWRNWSASLMQKARTLKGG
jgi:hypothetical protein